MDLIKEDLSFVCPDGFSMPAHLIRPASDAPVPGIVFIFEAFGLNAEMKRIASHLAGLGYVVIMPNLFSRGSWFGCIRKAMKDIASERGGGVDDLIAARAWLARQPFVDGARMGVFGLCLGGGFAMVLAKKGLFQVAAPFYGTTPKSVEGACPIVASFGERDSIMTPAAAELEADLTRLNITHDVKVYPGVGHSFMNEPPNALLGFIGKIMPTHGAFDAAAAKDAMMRVQRFLAEHL